MRSLPETQCQVAFSARERCVVAAESENWRCLEAEARLIALSKRDLESKRVMLSIADSYSRLAERADVLNPRQLDGASFGTDT